MTMDKGAILHAVKFNGVELDIYERRIEVAKYGGEYWFDRVPTDRQVPVSEIDRLAQLLSLEKFKDIPTVYQRLANLLRSSTLTGIDMALSGIHKETRHEFRYLPLSLNSANGPPDGTPITMRCIIDGYAVGGYTTGDTAVLMDAHRLLVSRVSGIKQCYERILKNSNKNSTEWNKNTRTFLRNFSIFPSDAPHNYDNLFVAASRCVHETATFSDFAYFAKVLGVSIKSYKVPEESQKPKEETEEETEEGTEHHNSLGWVVINGHKVDVRPKRLVVYSVSGKVFSSHYRLQRDYPIPLLNSLGLKKDTLEDYNTVLILAQHCLEYTAHQHVLQDLLQIAAIVEKQKEKNKAAKVQPIQAQVPEPVKAVEPVKAEEPCPGCGNIGYCNSNYSTCKGRHMSPVEPLLTNLSGAKEFRLKRYKVYRELILRVDDMSEPP